MEFKIKVISNGFILSEDDSEDDTFFPTLRDLVNELALLVKPMREVQGYSYKIGEIDPEKRS